jgi:mannose-1-phosphate guanylyltransferase
MEEGITPPWALILAGGDGTRLRPLTSQITGDGRPKQFCRLVEGETLLDRTRRRVDLLVRFDHQLVVVTRMHEPFYERLAHELTPGRLIVQPENRGTAAGILYPVLHLIHLAGDVPLVIAPSDHYVSDDATFMAHAAAAVEAIRVRRDQIVVLGIEPTTAEPEYGWIGAGDQPWPGNGPPIFPIRRFWEKPSAVMADRLMRAGALWNSFVMVGWASTFVELVRTTEPGLLAVFGDVRRALGTPGEERAVARTYRSLPSTGFSESVLARGTGHLGVIRVKGVDWSDWGHPRRVVASLARAGVRPSWLDHVELKEAG